MNIVKKNPPLPHQASEGENPLAWQAFKIHRALGMPSLLVVCLPGCLWATALNKTLAKDNSPYLIVAAYHFEALPLKAELVYIGNNEITNVCFLHSKQTVG